MKYLQFWAGVVTRAHPVGLQRQRDSAPLLSPFWVSGVRVRTGALSGLSSPLWLDTQLALSDIWVGVRKEGGNRDFAALS